MNVLLIGGCHLYGYGLTSQQPSFVDQFVSQLRKLGHSPQLTSYVCLPLTTTGLMLAQLELHTYDLIVVQPAHYDLQHPASFWHLFTSTKQRQASQGSAPRQPADLTALRSQLTNSSGPIEMGAVKHLKNLVKHLFLIGGSQLGLLNHVLHVEHELRALLTQLQGYRDRVLVLTPMPHRESVSHWLRQRGRRFVIKESHRQGLFVIDTHGILRPEQALYLPNDAGHLNARGHQLLGEALFASYQASVG